MKGKKRAAEDGSSLEANSNYPSKIQTIPKNNETIVEDIEDDDDVRTLTAKFSSCYPIADVTPSCDHGILSDEQIRATVRWLLPGLADKMLRYYRGQRNRGLQQLNDAMNHSMKELSIKVGLEQWFKLMKPENAVELCVALGLNERIIRERYKAVGNLQRELGCKTRLPLLFR